MPARVLVVGDIHGCSGALNALLAAVRPGKNDMLVTLGDYVDRGFDSAGVLDRLIELRNQTQLISLRGNHEEMMIDARKGEQLLQFWLNCGGDSTLVSYPSDVGEPRIADIPSDHWRFLEEECVDWFETERHLFVHAGVRAEVPPSEQSLTDLHWRSFGENTSAHSSGKTVICGHIPDPTGTIRDLGHTICIDTGAGHGGWLSCLDVNSGAVWQANERGTLRRLQM